MRHNPHLCFSVQKHTAEVSLWGYQIDYTQTESEMCGSSTVIGAGMDLQQFLLSSSQPSPAAWRLPSPWYCAGGEADVFLSSSPAVTSNQHQLISWGSNFGRTCITQLQWIIVIYRLKQVAAMLPHQVMMKEIKIIQDHTHTHTHIITVRQHHKS